MGVGAASDVLFTFPWVVLVRASPGASSIGAARRIKICLRWTTRDGWFARKSDTWRFQRFWFVTPREATPAEAGPVHSSPHFNKGSQYQARDRRWAGSPSLGYVRANHPPSGRLLEVSVCI